MAVMGHCFFNSVGVRFVRSLNILSTPVVLLMCFFSGALSAGIPGAWNSIGLTVTQNGTNLSLSDGFDQSFNSPFSMNPVLKPLSPLTQDQMDRTTNGPLDIYCNVGAPFVCRRSAAEVCAIAANTQPHGFALVYGVTPGGNCQLCNDYGGVCPPGLISESPYYPDLDCGSGMSVSGQSLDECVIDSLSDGLPSIPNNPDCTPNAAADPDNESFDLSGLSYPAPNRVEWNASGQAYSATGRATSNADGSTTIYDNYTTDVMKASGSSTNITVTRSRTYDSQGSLLGDSYSAVYTDGSTPQVGDQIGSATSGGGATYNGEPLSGSSGAGSGDGTNTAPCPLPITPPESDVGDNDKNLGCDGKTRLDGNPCNPVTGNKFLSETDYESPFPEFAFVRRYNSQLAEDTGLGVGWTNPFGAPRLEINGSDLLVRRADGRGYAFINNAGTWTGDADNPYQLSQAGPVYTLIGPDDVTETYNSQGQLGSVTSLAGFQLTFSYDGQNLLDVVTSNTGHSLNFTWDGNNHITGILDQAGRVWGYRYDANGNLEFVDNPDTTSKQYHYEDTNFPNVLTGITDERAIRFSTYAYDEEGRVSTSARAGNADRIDITYSAKTFRTLTNSLGEVTNYTVIPQLGTALLLDVSGPGCATCAVTDTSYAYEPTTNDLIVKNELGVITQYGAYDVNGNPGFIINAQGIPEQRRTDYTYDSRFYNKITTITEPSVFASDPAAQCTPDTDCKVTTYTYDAFGNRLSETIAGFTPTGTPVSRTTTWTYAGPLNQLSQIDGPRTDVTDTTQYRYYANDVSQGNNRARLREIEDAAGVLTRSSIQYTVTGKVQSEARPNGLSLNHTYYPGNDRLQTLTETDTLSGATRITRWTYLATGEVETITTADGTPDATTLTFGYDDARRLTRLTNGLGHHIDYTLDTEGNRLSETTYDANGTPSNTADDVIRRQLTQTFDIYNRLDTTAKANETTNPNFATDGTLDTEIDGNGSVTDYSYDSLKRLTQTVQDQGGAILATANTTTAYGYDVADRLTSVTDPNSGATTYSYDDLGNLLNQTSPDTGSTTFVYDSAGNLTQKTDALGQVFTYTYNALNRLTGLNAPGTEDDIVYTYDDCTQGTGKLCTVTYGTGIHPTGNQARYQYNAFNDIAQHQGLIYGYDAQGRVQTLDYPSGARLTTQYDAAGQVSQMDIAVNGQTQTLASNLNYAPFGPVTGLTFGNGLTLTQTLDTAYRLTAQNTTGVLERSYPQYDANGNRQSQTDALASASSFAYDSLNRLDTGSGPFGARDYDYDKSGNRTQLVADSVTTALAYVPNSNRLNTLGGVSVVLDANGNTLSQNNWTYTFTPHNRLKTATEGATLKASFSYNGLGQRTHKTDEANTTGQYTLYGTSGERLVDTDENGNLLTEYIYLNGQLLALYAPDDDQDGLTNQQEAEQGTLPTNTDSDGDGLTNLEEWFQHGTDSINADSDGDGIDDGVEIAAGTDPTQGSNILGDGDINADGVINVGDLVLLYQFVMGNRTPTAAELTHADMNQDGTLNVADILLLQRQLLQVWLGVNVTVVKVKIERPQTKTNAALPVLDWLIAPAQALPNNSGFLYYVHNDPLGTPQALTDESGITVWTATYDPFGKATVNEDPDNNGNNIALNARFPGQYYDQETGLHYNYFRYYDSGTGRYLKSDPIGLAGGLNTYGYVGGNPIGSIDYFGLVDLNLFNPRDSIHSSANNTPPTPGVFTVGGHGNPSTIVDAEGNPLTPSQLAKMIKKHPDFSSGTTVRLMSCNTGDDTGAGGPSFGKRLQDELGEFVEAPDNYVWYYPDGRTKVAPYNSSGGGPDLTSPGTYRTFP